MRPTTLTLVVAIAMLLVGAAVGYGLGSSAATVRTVVSTVASPVTVTFLSPLTATARVTETATFITVRPTTITVPVTVTTTYTPRPTSRIVEASVGQVVSAGPWRVAVLYVREATYVKAMVLGSWSYYQAPEGTRVVIVRLRVENAGTEVRYPFGPAELSTPVLITSTNRSCGTAYTYELKRLWSPSQEVVERAVEYSALDIFSKLAPGTFVEGDFMYIVPEGETPLKLYITYWPSPFEKVEIVVRLTR